MWVSHFGTHCIWYITQSPWSWNQSGVSSAKARLMFDLSPFGGSLVTLTLFCRTDTGNDLAGIELRYSRKPECTSSGFSAMDLTISSIDNIHDAARWQFYIKTSRKRHSLTAVVDVKLKLPSLIYALQYRLTSRKPLWSDVVPVDILSQWRDDWSSATVVNCDLVQDPTIRLLGFSLPWKQWCTLDHFRTSQGHCGACCKLWGLADSDLCTCGPTHTVSHIVESCPLTKLDGGLLLLLLVCVSWTIIGQQWNSVFIRRL